MTEVIVIMFTLMMTVLTMIMIVTIGSSRGSSRRRSSSSGSICTVCRESSTKSCASLPSSLAIFSLLAPLWGGKTASNLAILVLKVN